MTGGTSTQVMHVMDGNLRAQDNERIPATFVYAGIDVERSGLFSGIRGKQIAGRFALIPTGPFPLAGEWQRLIASLETLSGSTATRPGPWLASTRYLHQRTGGMIGSLSHLIRGAAIQAILPGPRRSP